MKYHLIVTRQFSDPKDGGKVLKPGVKITDQDVVERVLSSHLSSFVVKVPEGAVDEKPEEKKSDPKSGDDKAEDKTAADDKLKSQQQKSGDDKLGAKVDDKTVKSS